jgi:hypothetical protein
MIESGHKFELSASKESAEDATARRMNEAADMPLERKKTWWLFLCPISLLAIVFSGCVYVFATGTSDDKKWAAGIVSAIASGLVGFLVGQGRK